MYMCIINFRYQSNSNNSHVMDAVRNLIPIHNVLRANPQTDCARAKTRVEKKVYWAIEQYIENESISQPMICIRLSGHFWLSSNDLCRLLLTGLSYQFRVFMMLISRIIKMVGSNNGINIFYMCVIALKNYMKTNGTRLWVMSKVSYSLINWQTLLFIICSDSI